MRFLAPFLFLITSISSVHAATLSLHAIDSATALVLVDGHITPGDAHILQAYIELSRTSTLKLAMVSFNSPGGNLEEGYKLATEIKRARLATEVEAEKICASACFFAFAAGTTKWTAPSARVGVHGAADANGVQSGTAASATIVMARWAAKELGIPSDIIGKMVTTPPSDIIWLSHAELNSMGAQTLDRSHSGTSNWSPPDPEALAKSGFASGLAAGCGVCGRTLAGSERRRRSIEPLLLAQHGRLRIIHCIPARRRPLRNCANYSEPGRPNHFTRLLRAGSLGQPAPLHGLGHQKTKRRAKRIGWSVDRGQLTPKFEASE